MDMSSVCQFLSLSRYTYVYHVDMYLSQILSLRRCGYVDCMSVMSMLSISVFE